MSFNTVTVAIKTVFSTYTEAYFVFGSGKIAIYIYIYIYIYTYSMDSSERRLISNLYMTQSVKV